MKKVFTWIPHILALYVSVVFLSALPFKFADDIKTQVIFGKLDSWAATLGLPGLFDHSGIFSQYVIGSAELLASVLLLAGIFPLLRSWQRFGALLSFAIMAGAVFFHLFTPLGIDPNNDGGGLFLAAVGALFASVAIIIFRSKEFKKK